MRQNTNKIFMVRPAHFGYNEQTAVSNTFQQGGEKIRDVQQKAQAEFDETVKTLRSSGIEVWVIDDTTDVIRPDAVFPNNWISTHEDGTIILYPMLTENRRIERRADIVETLKKEYAVARVIDLSSYEHQEIFLEGTGSIVFDHINHLAYASLSPRTNKILLEDLCKAIHYLPVTFRAVNEGGIEVYHTNVIMSIGKEFAIICLESIADEAERNLVSNTLKSSGKEIVDISFEQMNHFAGNAISVSTADNKTVLALSATAFESLYPQQKKELEKYCSLLPVSIPTIETIGGGSLRCMIAQNFLP